MLTHILYFHLKIMKLMKSDIFVSVVLENINVILQSQDEYYIIIKLGSLEEYHVLKFNVIFNFVKCDIKILPAVPYIIVHSI